MKMWDHQSGPQAAEERQKIQNLINKWDFWLRLTSVIRDSLTQLEHLNSFSVIFKYFRVYILYECSQDQIWVFYDLQATLSLLHKTNWRSIIMFK